MEDRIPISIQVGAFELSLDSIRTALEGRYLALVTQLMQAVAAKTKVRCEDLTKKSEASQKTLRTTCENIEEVTALKEYMAELPELVRELHGEIDLILKNYELLDEYRYEYAKDDTKRRWNTYSQLLRISQSVVDYAHLQMRSDKDKFEEELVEAQEDFAGEIQSLTSRHQQLLEVL